MGGTVSRTLEALRAEGRRITTARRLVIELLARTSEHLTADDLATRIHDAHPEIHLSTVYRTLDSLRGWELVEHVHQPHGPSFFHLAGAHRHLVCDQCGRIHDVPAAEFDVLVTRIREQYGFELHLGHVALVGRCRDHGDPTATSTPEFPSAVASTGRAGSESIGISVATGGDACSAR